MAGEAHVIATAAEIPARGIQMRLRYTASGFTDAELAFVARTLADRRGWKNKGFRFAFVRRPRRPVHFALLKVPGREVARRFPALSGLSVTDARARPVRVYINADNWRAPPAVFTASRHVYRQYLINHEVGHVLGYGHDALPPSPHRPCSVMYQQTRGTARCRPNPWPR